MRLHLLLIAALLPAALQAKPPKTPAKPYVPTDPANGWVPVVVPEGGLLCLMGDYNTLIAGTGRGIHLSLDRAKTWTLVADAGPVAWIVEQDSAYFAGASDGLLHSTDGGKTWKMVLQAGAPAEAIARVEDRLFLGVRGIGMFRTMVEGGKWKEAPGSPENRNIRSVIAVEDSVLLAGGPGGVYRSVDLSRQWSLPDQGLGEPVLQLLADRDGTAYALTETREVYTSEDGGLTWSLEQTGLDSAEVQSLGSLVRTGYVVGKGGVYCRRKKVGWGRIPGLEAENITCMTFVNYDLFAGSADKLFMKKNAPFTRTDLDGPPEDPPVLPLPD